MAWRAIEQGWSVFDAAGNEIGKVDQVTGDLNGDIFNGITVGDGGTVLTRPRYVPAEQVGAIREGEIVLRLAPEEVSALKPFREPISEPLASLLPEPERPSDEKTRPDAASPFGMGFPFGRGPFKMLRDRRH